MLRSHTEHVPRLTKLGYGVGHVANDLCASLWFSYVLVYFRNVAHLSEAASGSLLLFGQVVDAVSTPLVGLVSDKSAAWCRYGRRKACHAVGSVLVLCSFPFIFNPCLFSDESQVTTVLYYGFFVMVFQVGWAIVQVSHLTILPELTRDPEERVSLNSIRCAATVLASVTVGVLIFLILRPEDSPIRISKIDSIAFTRVSTAALVIGVLCTIVFHVIVKEHNVSATLSGAESDSEDENDDAFLKQHSQKRWYDWFRVFSFYPALLIYTSARLIGNITQVYMPMYLTESLLVTKSNIGLVNLSIYVTSFFSSLCAKYLNHRLGRPATLLGGFFFISVYVVSVVFLSSNTLWLIMLAASCLGVGSALILVSGLSMISDMIGLDTGTAAFVYGAMSFGEKLTNGLVVELIQTIRPCFRCCTDCRWYFRNIQLYTTIISSSIGIAGLVLQKCYYARTAIVRRYQVKNCGGHSQEVEELNPLVSNTDN